MKTLILYSRPECHLCEEVAEELAPLVRGRAEVRIADVDDDPELQRRFGLRIPVLCSAEGEEISSYPLDHARVERHLRS